MNVFKLIIGCLFFLSFTHCALTAFNRRGDNAEDYFEEGNENIKRKLWADADNAFAQLRAKFPYSKYAVLAELSQADVKFKSERYTESIDAYDLFIQAHPLHERVGYAYFMQASAHYEEIASDFFLFPPGYEKDDTEVKKAIQGFKDYLSRYPQAEFSSDAQKRLQECKQKLIAHDLYVARFYAQRKKYQGALYRYESIYALKEDIPMDAALLYEMASVYDKNANPKKRDQLHCDIIKDFTSSKQAQKIKTTYRDLKCN